MIIFCGLRPLSYLCILDISIGSVVLGKLIATGICDCTVIVRTEILFLDAIAIKIHS